MELFIIAVLLAVPIAILAALVTAVVALRRNTGLEARIKALETQLAASRPVMPQAETPPQAAATPPPDLHIPAAAETPTPSHPEPPPPTPPPARPVPTGPAKAELPSAPSQPAPRGPRGTPPQTPPVHSPGMQWEQWLGVRGAAVAGGVVLSLAAILLFKYTIDHGLITPALRVAFGLLGGTAALVASQWLHGKGQRWGADGLAGGGIVALYAALWAAHVLYGLVSLATAVALMVLVTLTCGFLALRRPSLLVGVLGLAGGFTTPLLVGASPSRPLELFAYILLLDAGVLALAHRRRWPLLAVLAMAGTFLWQLWWVMGHLKEGQVLLAMGILGAFALAFAASTVRAEGIAWRSVSTGAVLLPLGLAGALVIRSNLHVPPVPLFSLLAVLTAAGLWIAASAEEDWLGLACAVTALGVGGAWVLTGTRCGAEAWVAAAAMAGYALVVHLAAIWLLPSKDSQLSLADPIVAAGLLAASILASTARPAGSPWPCLFLWLALGSLLTVHALRRPWLHLLGATGPTAGLLVWSAAHWRMGTHLPWSWILVATLVLALVPRLVAVARRRGSGVVWAERGAALAALIALFIPLVVTSAAGVLPLPALATTIPLILLAAAAASRLGSGPMLLVSVIAAALVQTGMAIPLTGPLFTRPAAAMGLALEGFTALLLTAWPLASHPAFVRKRLAWAAASLAGPLWFPALYQLWVELFGKGAIGVLPILLALAALGVFAAARRSLESSPARHAMAAWYLGVTLCLVSVAIPLQLEKSWITIGWALNGLALLALWRRIPAAGLKWFGLTLLTAVTVRLVVNPSVLSYWPRGHVPILNWLAYTYWIPILALARSWKILSQLEEKRLQAWEERLFGGRGPGTLFTGFATVATIFAWLNLAVIDLYSPEGMLSFPSGHLPARDLTTSLVWAVYAVILLGAGMYRDSGGLRWLSLGLLLATLFKVFLYDLGTLTDLYRVGSLLGLAVSLILVSLAYQRFVLSRQSTEEP